MGEESVLLCRQVGSLGRLFLRPCVPRAEPDRVCPPALSPLPPPPFQQPVDRREQQGASQHPVCHGQLWTCLRARGGETGVEGLIAVRQNVAQGLIFPVAGIQAWNGSLALANFVARLLA